MPLMDSVPVPVFVSVTTWVFTVLRLLGVAKTKFVADKATEGVDCANVLNVHKKKNEISCNSPKARPGTK